MNQAEVQSFARDFHEASGETDEPGTSSTRIHVPAGIALPRTPTGWRRRMDPKIGTLDHTFGSRSVNAAIKNDAIRTAREVEDDLIAFLDGDLDNEI